MAMDTDQEPPAIPAPPQHHVGLYADGGEFRVLPTPAPAYRAGDQCEAAALSGPMQLRPLMLSDMIPNVAYRPGSMLLSRYFPQVGVTARIVGVVGPAQRSNALDAIKALMSAQDAAQRGELRDFLTYFARARLMPHDGRPVTEADIEQSVVATMIL